MDRITQKNLNELCGVLNKVTGSPLKAWVRDDAGKLHAQIGNFHINQAYGGVELQRMMNEGGGIDTPLGYGHVPKRELWNKMQAFLRGLELAKGLDSAAPTGYRASRGA